MFYSVGISRIQAPAAASQVTLRELLWRAEEGSQVIDLTAVSSRGLTEPAQGVSLTSGRGQCKGWSHDHRTRWAPTSSGSRGREWRQNSQTSTLRLLHVYVSTHIPLKGWTWDVTVCFEDLEPECKGNPETQEGSKEPVLLSRIKQRSWGKCPSKQYGRQRLPYTFHRKGRACDLCGKKKKR